MSLILYHAMCHMSCHVPYLPTLFCCLSVLLSFWSVVFLICCPSDLLSFWSVVFLSLLAFGLPICQNICPVSCHVSYVMPCALLAHTILLSFYFVFFQSSYCQLFLLSWFVILWCYFWTMPTLWHPPLTLEMLSHLKINLQLIQYVLANESLYLLYCAPIRGRIHNCRLNYIQTAVKL